MVRPGGVDLATTVRSSGNNGVKHQWGFPVVDPAAEVRLSQTSVRLGLN